VIREIDFLQNIADLWFVAFVETNCLDCENILVLNQLLLCSVIIKYSVRLSKYMKYNLLAQRSNG